MKGDGASAGADAPGGADASKGASEGASQEPDPRDLRIVNKKGLHARASARFVEVAGRFEAAVLVEKDGEEVSGNDLLGLLMLAGACGSTITVSAAGPDAVDALDALEALVASGFGERDGAPGAG